MKCNGVNMTTDACPDDHSSASPVSPILHTRYLLVATNSNDRSGSITKKHLDRLKLFAPRIESSNKALNPSDKKIGMYAGMHHVLLYATNSSTLIKSCINI